MSFYYEQASPSGAWCPVKAPLRPTIKNGREVKAGSIGARIRPDSVREINAGHIKEGLSLRALQMTYSQDGSLRWS